MNNGRRDAKVSRQLERFHLSKTGPLLCMPEYGLSKVRTLTQPPPCRFTYTSGARNTSQPSEKNLKSVATPRTKNAPRQPHDDDDDDDCVQLLSASVVVVVFPENLRLFKALLLQEKLAL